MKRWFLRSFLPPLMTLVLILVAVEVILWLSGSKGHILPRPSSVAVEVFHSRAALWAGILTTGKASLSGFALSVVVGMTVAIVMSAARWIERALYPYAIFFQTVPIIAIAPLLVVWIGAGYKAVTISAFIASVFPVVANTLTGLQATDPALRDMFRLYGAGPLSRLWKLKLPSATPFIITGLRISAGLAVIGAIVGEFVAGQAKGAMGLGQAVVVANWQYDTPLVYANVLAASLLGLALFGAVHFLGYLLMRRWHGSQK